MSSLDISPSITSIRTISWGQITKIQQTPNVFARHQISPDSSLPVPPESSRADLSDKNIILLNKQLLKLKSSLDNYNPSLIRKIIDFITGRFCKIWRLRRSLAEVIDVVYQIANRIKNQNQPPVTGPALGRTVSGNSSTSIGGTTGGSTITSGGSTTTGGTTLPVTNPILGRVTSGSSTTGGTAPVVVGPSGGAVTTIGSTTIGAKPSLGGSTGGSALGVYTFTPVGTIGGGRPTPVQVPPSVLIPPGVTIGGAATIVPPTPTVSLLPPLPAMSVEVDQVDPEPDVVLPGGTAGKVLAERIAAKKQLIQALIDSINESLKYERDNLEAGEKRRGQIFPPGRAEIEALQKKFGRLLRYFRKVSNRLDKNYDVPLPAFYHASRSGLAIIKSGVIRHCQAPMGNGTFVSSNDEGGAAGGMYGDYTFGLDESLIADLPAHYFYGLHQPGGAGAGVVNHKRSLWFCLKGDVPVNSIACMAAAEANMSTLSKALAERGFVTRRFEDGDNKPLTQRDVPVFTNDILIELRNLITQGPCQLSRNWAYYSQETGAGGYSGIPTGWTPGDLNEWYALQNRMGDMRSPLNATEEQTRKRLASKLATPLLPGVIAIAKPATAPASWTLNDIEEWNRISHVGSMWAQKNALLAKTGLPAHLQPTEAIPVNIPAIAPAKWELRDILEWNQISAKTSRGVALSAAEVQISLRLAVKLGMSLLPQEPVTAATCPPEWNARDIAEWNNLFDAATPLSAAEETYRVRLQTLMKDHLPHNMRDAVNTARNPAFRLRITPQRYDQNTPIPQ